MTKRLNEKRILNITLFYLSQYESSTDKVRAMLKRRLRRLKMQGEEIPPEAEQWIENALSKAKDYSYLNDDRYAENQVRLLVAQGKSEHFIIAKLKTAGIDSETVQHLLNETETTEADRADILMRRKRIGPYRPKKERLEYYIKDLATLARAGFSYETASTALNDTDS